MLGCAEKKTRLEQIQERGVVNIVTIAGPTTYQLHDEEGGRGLEFELVKLFAAWLGVDFEFSQADGREEITDLLASGQADVASAGLTRTSRTGRSPGVRSRFSMGDPPGGVPLRLYTSVLAG